LYFCTNSRIDSKLILNYKKLSA